MSTKPDEPARGEPAEPAAAEREPGMSRRRLFGFGAVGVAGVAGVAGATGYGLASGVDHPTTSSDAKAGEPSRAPAMTGRRVSTRAGRQPGVDGPMPAFAHFLALDLHPEARSEPARARAAATALLRDWTTLVATLHERGPAAVLDTPASADLRPSALAITVGFGAGLLDRTGRATSRPAALVDLPAFSGEALRPAYTGGDLCCQIAAEDPMVLAAATEALTARLDRRAVVRWATRGFQRTAAATPKPEAVPRNLMGQIDGTANPLQDDPLFEPTVVARADPGEPPAHGWMDGGSYLVVRRIRMRLDRWYAEETPARERVIGRTLSDGEPLGGLKSDGTVNLSARTDGTLAVPPRAHIRLASKENTDGARILRRSYNYDDGWTGPDGARDSGLLFLAWQADPRRGFVPIQRSLVDGDDRLNEFVVHEGSAVFAVPPAASGGHYLGQELLEG